MKNQETNPWKWWNGKKVDAFQIWDFKQSLDQIHVAKLINYEIDENGFFCLTREHSQVIPSVCLHILPTCKGYYSKKKPKRIWALIASFKSYEVFRFLYRVRYITLKFSFLTREHSQVTRSVCLHILPTCEGYYSKKKPKRIWVFIASFKSYEVFRFLYTGYLIIIRPPTKFSQK